MTEAQSTRRAGRAVVGSNKAEGARRPKGLDVNTLSGLESQVEGRVRQEEGKWDSGAGLSTWVKRETDTDGGVPLGFSLSRSVESRPRGLSAGRVAFRGGGFFRRCREGGERKREGEGREVARRERVWWSGLVHGTETDGGGRSGGWQWEGDSGERGTELGGRGRRRPLHGSSGVPEQCGEGTLGGGQPPGPGAAAT